MNAPRRILASKVFLPPPTIAVVARPRLLNRLQTALRRPLTTVITPAGFGKTTLLSTWAAGAVADGLARAAWLTLDRYDDDLSSFCASLIAALQTIDPALGREVLPLQSPMTPSWHDSPLAPLLSQLEETSSSSIVLIIDDYHVVNAPAVHTAVAFLIDHLPLHFHLIVSSRSDLSMPLARLRARGQLTELGAADLRFTQEEAASFLNDVMGLKLAPDLIADLETRTEGWITGLHLAALSMRDRADRVGLVRSLTGSHHYILDYLVEEVLQRQSAPARAFLLQTSILDRMCAPLCDAVTESTASATTLELVERANLFLVPLDDERRWYRYHHLFVEALRSRLAREQPADVPELHRRASVWYAQHAAGETAMQGEAIHHALAAGESERAVQLVSEVAEAVWASSELATLRAWLTALPTAVLQAHPRLVILLAQVVAVTGSYDELPPLLDAATAALARSVLSAHEQATLHGEVAAVRADVTRNAERLEEAMALAQQALSLLPESDQASRALATLGLALTHHMLGELPVAETHYRDTIALCEAAGDRYLEITTRCLSSGLMLECGNLVGAEAAFQHALKRATHGPQRLPIAGWALVGLGAVAYARNDLQRAEDLLLEGLELARRAGLRDAVLNGMAGLVRLRLAQGDPDRARQASLQFGLDAEASQIPHFIHWAAALQALVDLRHGDLTASARWARSFPPRPEALMFTYKAAFAIFIQVLLAQDRISTARQWIAQQRALATPHGHVETLIELDLLEALALWDSREPPAALAALGSALALAEPAGFVRLFLDAGEAIRTLLAQWTMRRGPGDPLRPFADHLLAAFKSDDAVARTVRPVANVLQPLMEPLSERELEVLRLMAAGLSNQAIADRLVISVPTVKKHGSNIFGKLHAASRTEAVARARELGLLA